MRMTRQPARGFLMLAGLMLVVTGTIGGSVAWAQHRSDPAGACARMGGFLTDDDREALGRILMQRARERLGLNDQQAEDIQATLKTMRDDSRADLQALCLARQDLRQLLAKQDSDPAALRAAADRVKALQGKLLDRRVEGQLALRSKLTPEQWAKWLELRKGMGHRRMGRGRAIAS